MVMSTDGGTMISYTIVTDVCESICDCVLVCPVECIRPATDGLNNSGCRYCMIDPRACINCGLCLDVCPIEGAVLDQWRPDLQKGSRNDQIE